MQHNFPQSANAPIAEKNSLEDLQAQCVHAVAYWVQQARALPDAGADQLQVPEVLFNLKGLVAGIAVVPRQPGSMCKVRINVDLLRRYPQEMIDNTVPHEVAHIVSARLYGHLGHGPAWRSVMAAFDKPATRCHQMQAQPARRHKKHRYACVCREHLVGPQINARIRKGTVYHCRRCAQPLQQTAER